MSANKYKDRLKKIIEGIQLTADKLGIHPSEVSKAQFMAQISDVTSWDLREVGGIGAVKRNHFPIVSKDLVAIRQQQEVGKYVRELEKKLGEVQLLDSNMRNVINDAVSSLKLEKISVAKPPKLKGRPMTMELMLSDIHYGKKTDKFNLAVCRSRMQDLSKVFLAELERREVEGFNVERVIIALIGDLIESYTMHGLESAAGCEFGNAMQVQAAITSLFHDVIVPIAQTGIQVDVPAVTGNHDRSDMSRTMQLPGENNLTWIIYNSLEELCRASGLKNVKFIIPKGSFVILDIYGNNCLYEHGDNVGANTKQGFEALMERRAKQSNCTLHFGRFGHFHEYACFDRGRIIVNESVCGQDSYAEVKGFRTSAGQTINYYVKTENRPSCFYFSFPVWLG